MAGGGDDRVGWGCAVSGRPPSGAGRWQQAWAWIAEMASLEADVDQDGDRIELLTCTGGGEGCVGGCAGAGDGRFRRLADGGGAGVGGAELSAVGIVPHELHPSLVRRSVCAQVALARREAPDRGAVLVNLAQALTCGPAGHHGGVDGGCDVGVPRDVGAPGDGVSVAGLAPRGGCGAGRSLAADGESPGRRAGAGAGVAVGSGGGEAADPGGGGWAAGDVAAGAGCDGVPDGVVAGRVGDGVLAVVGAGGRRPRSRPGGDRRDDDRPDCTVGGAGAR